MTQHISLLNLGVVKMKNKGIISWRPLTNGLPGHCDA